MFLFKRKSKSCLGIDIGDSAIKIVELEQKESRHKLVNYGIFSLKEYLGDNWYQTSLKSGKLSSEELAQLIKKIFDEAKFNSKKAYVSLPIYSSFSTLIDFPPMPEKEIAAAVSFEAKKYVPIPIAEVILDWSIVRWPNPLKEKKIEERKMPNDSASQKAPLQKMPDVVSQKQQINQTGGPQVLLIAVPREVINNYKKIVRIAGLNLAAMETETFSLSRALVGNDKSSIVLIDIGSRSVNVSIVDNGYVRVISNLEMGGTKLTKTIAEQMDIGLDQAEKMKRNLLSQEVKENFQLKEIIQPVLEALIFEIKKIINVYEDKYQRRVEKCILAGRGVQLPNLSEYFINKLNLEVSLGNPFARLVYPEKIEAVLKEELGPSLAVAVGLAMRD